MAIGNQAICNWQ